MRARDSRKNSGWGCDVQLFSAVQSSLHEVASWLARVEAITKNAAETINAGINTLRSDCFFITFEMFDEVSAIMLREF